MLTIILIMASGILLGRIIRNRNLSFLSKIIDVLIWVLLFLLGVEVGGDDRIVKGIVNLGAEAVGISLAAVAGSTIFAWGLWKWCHKTEADKK